MHAIFFCVARTAVRKGGGVADKMGKDEGSFMTDMLLGGVSGAIVKTAMAPVERVKLLLQTQDSNPKVISGEIPKYTGIADCFKRVSAEQGALCRVQFLNTAV